jgi:hypothetical protein
VGEWSSTLVSSRVFAVPKVLAARSDRRNRHRDLTG